jgi:hypothetical protein
VVNKDETLEAIIAGAKANGSWDKKYPDDDKKVQPAQEPVAYFVNCCFCGEEKRIKLGNHHPWCCCGSDSFDWANARDEFSEQPAQESEPDEFAIAYMSGLHDGKKKRPWAGLTDEETIDLAVKVGARLDLPPATKMQLQQQFIDALRKPDSLWMLFARDIEAKLKEKNT